MTNRCLASVRFAKGVALLWIGLQLVACQGPAPRSTGTATSENPSTPMMPMGSEHNERPTPTPPTLPSASAEAHKVAVILGPGGAKALAHVGVLKAFQQQRIPIGKVVGLEWGALIGGLFAVNGQTHDVEWKLYKMEQKNLPRPKGFFAQRLDQDSVKIMEDYFQEVFANQDVSTSKISFECPSRSVWTGVVTWQSRGAFRDVMKRCLPFPPLFKASGSFIAGPSQVAESIERLRGQGYDVIILVNVLSTALPVDQDSLLDNLNYVILWQEIKRALAEGSKMGVDVVNVDTRSVPMVQFSTQKDLINSGEAAGLKAAAPLISKYGF